MTKQNATHSRAAPLPISLTLADQDKFLSTVFYTYSFEWIILTFTILVTDFNTVWLFNSHLINSFWQRMSFYSLHQNNLLIERKKPNSYALFPSAIFFKWQGNTLHTEIKRIDWILDQDAKCNLCTLLFRKKNWENILIPFVLNEFLETADNLFLFNCGILGKKPFGSLNERCTEK